MAGAIWNFRVFYKLEGGWTNNSLKNTISLGGKT